MRLTCTVNGIPNVTAECGEEESLLFVLRERLGLYGAKNACEQGECGSCTVLLDGQPVCSCLVAAGQVDGHEITTVEGMAGDEGLTVVQECLAASGAVQCGFCTPGIVVTAQHLVEHVPDPSDLEIREALAGNLCRCTGYEKIIEGVRDAARRTAAPTTTSVVEGAARSWA